MYKYKWCELNVDTHECISYEKNDKGKKTGKIIGTSLSPLNGAFESNVVEFSMGTPTAFTSQIANKILTEKTQTQK